MDELAIAPNDSTPAQPVGLILDEFDPMSHMIPSVSDDVGMNIDSIPDC